MFTIVFGDGSDNGPTNSHLSELPNDWNNEDSFVRRHYVFGNYTFADGHVKSLKSTVFQEWMDYAEDEQEASKGITRQMHYKFSPSQSAFRLKK